MTITAKLMTKSEKNQLNRSTGLSVVVQWHWQWLSPYKKTARTGKLACGKTKFHEKD